MRGTSIPPSIYSIMSLERLGGGRRGRGDGGKQEQEHNDFSHGMQIFACLSVCIMGVKDVMLLLNIFQIFTLV